MSQFSNAAKGNSAYNGVERVKGKVSKFQFYELLCDYHPKDNRHNPKVNISGSDDVMVALVSKG